MSFPAYPSYRDSGLEWLGAIPSHWAVLPLKWLLVANDGGVWGDDPDGENDTLVLRSTEQTVDGQWQIDDPALRKIRIADREKALLRAGDLLVTKSSGSALHIGKATLVDDEIARFEACYSNFMQRLRPSERMAPRLVWYFLNSRIARSQLDLLSNSTTGLANLNGTMLGLLETLLPPQEEQVAIIHFLDRETAKIDALVEEQRRLIELLKEKRQAVISHAVTKGLDPTAPMKDSGVEWLGEVPAHWEVKPLKYLTPPDRAIMYGIVLPGPDVGTGIPIVKGGDVKEHRLSLDTLCYTTPEIEAPYARARLRPDDIVYSIRGSIGDAELVPEELLDANITQDVARISPAGEVNPHWLLLVMRAKPVFVQLEQRSLGAAVRGINIYDLKRAYIPVPPCEEQNAIAMELAAQLGKLSQLEKAASRSIELMQEHRAALISAAVTGKIDVRGTATRSAEAA